MGDSRYTKIFLSIENRDDGVYLIVENYSGEPVPYAEIMKVVKGAFVTNLDMDAINRVASSKERNVVQRISSYNKIANITVSPDKMKAYIEFLPPPPNSEPLTLAKIMDIVEHYGIKFGVRIKDMEVLANNREIGKRYLLAEGRPSKPDSKGKVVYYFDTSARSMAPKIHDDGRADYTDIKFFEPVKAGQVVASIVCENDSERGINVFNEYVPYTPNKNMPKLPEGINVQVSLDGISLYAKCSGSVELDGDKVVISPILDVSSAVGLETGNIDFDGNVVIKGGVSSGFKVKATGDIEIEGIVEDAQIEAEGNINLSGGVVGGPNTSITAGKDIFVKFVQNAKITSGNDINSDSIMHCQVKCGGSIRLTGTNALIAGGNVFVENEIHAKTIGSPMATPTEISLGNSQEMLDKYAKLKEELRVNKEDYEKMTQISDSIVNGRNIEDLSDSQKNILLKTMHTKAYIRGKVEEINKEIKLTLMELGKPMGSVYASETVHSGVKILIGNAYIYVRDDIPSCILKNVDGRITVEPLNE